MMEFYQELTLLPQDEISIHFLWSKVFQQLHLGLVELQDSQKQVPIGVSFPEYVVGEKFSLLGSKCRLFAAGQVTLENLDIGKWLQRLSDYVHVTSIRPVPNQVMGYATYQRLQAKTNPESLARRYARRHQLSFDEAWQRYSSMQPPSISTPFIRLDSLSNGQTFCLWIKKLGAQSAQAGVFSTYGLSATSTVPEF
jgi:CRISPR-associated endonuclease Csy4